MIKKFKKVFKTEDSRFLLFTGFKVVSAAFIICLFVAYLYWIVISINNVFFEANGFLGIEDLRQAYFDYILSTLLEWLPLLILFFIVLFFVGIYVGKILLRPFELIGSYCQDSIEGNAVVYNPDLFSDFKILTRFGEFFFRFIDDVKKSKKLDANSIPPNFTKIHKPVFDRVFFFHFSLFIIIICILTSFVIMFTTVEIHTNMVNLSIKTLKGKGATIGYFLNNQAYILHSIQYVAIGLVVSSYFLMALHLYSRVSGAAFGFFSTMRSFMKGNHSARVHLVGYNHVRPHSRSFNKYLDYIQRMVAEDKKS